MICPECCGVGRCRECDGEGEASGDECQDCGATGKCPNCKSKNSPQRKSVAADTAAPRAQGCMARIAEIAASAVVDALIGAANASARS